MIERGNGIPKGSVPETEEILDKLVKKYKKGTDVFDGKMDALEYAFNELSYAKSHPQEAELAGGTDTSVEDVKILSAIEEARLKGEFGPLATLIGDKGEEFLRTAGESKEWTDFGIALLNLAGSLAQS